MKTKLVKSPIVFVVMTLFAIQFVFVGCDMEDVLSGQNSAGTVLTSEYVFVNPDWILIDKSYVDEDGIVGMLYQNANNPDQCLFEYVGTSKASSNPDCPNATGTLKKIDNKGVITYTCEPPAHNCWPSSAEIGGKTVPTIKVCL
ncbi:MAG: hypothetical protein LBQ22_00870 [Bacteroidales bacterium]|jgi:hypothetical protein|nr:hypothetical protein [Bacteroidales bacterium]